eukprot:10176748-Heterocapsa_arctica.AAC.1
MKKRWSITGRNTNGSSRRRHRDRKSLGKTLIGRKTVGRSVAGKPVAAGVLSSPSQSQHEVSARAGNALQQVHHNNSTDRTAKAQRKR